MGFLDLLRRKKSPDLDGEVLVQLRKAGSDLSKPHLIEFFLYLPSQSFAEEVARKVRASAFSAKVEPAAKGNDWLCLATKEMIPDLAALQKIRSDFDSLTRSMGGVYDGWGTPVVN